MPTIFRTVLRMWRQLRMHAWKVPVLETWILRIEICTSTEIIVSQKQGIPFPFGTTMLNGRISTIRISPNKARKNLCWGRCEPFGNWSCPVRRPNKSESQDDAINTSSKLLGAPRWPAENHEDGSGLPLAVDLKKTQTSDRDVHNHYPVWRRSWSKVHR